MDRPSFLSSMPFLLPCPWATWPPRRNAASMTEEEQQKQTQPTTQMDVLLDNTPQKAYKFHMAVEPAISASATADATSAVEAKDDVSHALSAMQPAFFGPPAVEDADGGHSSHTGNNNNSASSLFDPAMTRSRFSPRAL